MDLPKPPEDVELKNVIDKLANFVARNGPEFERMTKEKQRDNLRFSFLFGGEYFNYYQYRVTTEQAILRQQQQKLSQQQALGMKPVGATSSLTSSAPWQQQSQQQMLLQQQQHQLQEQLDQMRLTATEQIKQSEQNLAAQYTSLMQQQQLQIDDAIEKLKQQRLLQLCEESGVSLAELDSVVQPIIESCTKEAISNGKNWVFSRCQNDLQTTVFAEYLRKRIFDPAGSFELRLHLIYLINDILHHSTRRNVESLRLALSLVVVPIYCLTFLNTDDDRRQKLAKLLTLWEQNQYFDINTVAKMKDAATGWTDYKSTLLSEHRELVNSVTADIGQRYAMLQQQHQEFVTHLNNQIRQLEQQLQQITQQLIAGGLPPPSTAGSQGIPTGPMGGINIPLPPHGPLSAGGPMPFLPGFAPPISRFGAPPPGFIPPPNSFEPTSNLSGSSNIPPLMPPDFEYGGGNSNEYGGSNGMGEYGHSSSGNEYGPSGGEYGGPEFGRNIGEFGQVAPTPGFPIPDLSRPPPGFMPGFMPGPPPSQLPLDHPLMAPPEDLVPKVPYYDLPAGLMVPLVKLEDFDFKPINPKDIRLPPPMPPSERLLAAVEAFYSPPSHERPRDSEGWEKLGLYEFYRAKQKAKKEVHHDDDSRSRSRSGSRSHSRSHSNSPQRQTTRKDSRSSSRSRSRSCSPYQRTSKSRSRSRSKSRSYSPPPRRRRTPEPEQLHPPLLPDPILITAAPDIRLGMDNKGHQLLTKMGWGGGGLGLGEQGMTDPVATGEVRDRNDMFKGIGIPINDPFEQFRKSKAQGYGSSRSKSSV